MDEALDTEAKGEKSMILFNLSGHGHFDLPSYESYCNGKLEDCEHPAEAMQDTITRLLQVLLPM